MSEFIIYYQSEFHRIDDEYHEYYFLLITLLCCCKRIILLFTYQKPKKTALREHKANKTNEVKM